MDMMGKLTAVKENFEKLKEKLDNQTFTETSSDGALSITLTELATIQDIQISAGLLADKEQLEDTLVVTLNKALEKVKENAMKEAKETIGGGFPAML